MINALKKKGIQRLKTKTETAQGAEIRHFYEIALIYDGGERTKKLVRASCMNHGVAARTITKNNSYSERAANIQH